MQMTFQYPEAVTKHITTYWFQPESSLRYEAGQFAEVSIPHDNPDRKGIKRWFTLSSSPTETLISITLKEKESPDSSFRRALKKLAPGAIVHISQPLGDYVLPINTKKPLIFVASGIGITPVRSIVKWLHDKGQRRNIHIFYITRTEADIAYEDLFTAYGTKFDVFLTDPGKHWQGQTGRPAAGDIIKRSGLQPDSVLYYLSGIQSMVETMQQQLIANHQVARSGIILDYFPGYDDV